MSSRPSRKRCRCAALVQASLERLQNAEASWDRDVRASGAMFEAVEQRSKRHLGRQKDLVRKHVAEMANNLWATKFPAFGRLDDDAKKSYWAQIFSGYKIMYAAASRPALDAEGAERAGQFVSQTESVLQRQHVLYIGQRCSRSRTC